MLNLDHVALGLSNARPTIQALTAELGGTVIGGGVPPGSGFRAMQIHLGTAEHPGMTVELLEPWEVEHNDFLARFLERHGDGPHHITFKTHDVVAEKARLERLGYEPVAVNFSNPMWREMFLHPRQSHGTVVQIAQPGFEAPPMPELLRLSEVGMLPAWDEGTWWGDAAAVRSEQAVRLVRVVVTSPTVDETVSFFVDVLGARRAGDGLVRWDGGEIQVESGTAGVGRFVCVGLGAAERRVGGVRLVEAG